MRFLVFAGALILAEGVTQGFVPIAGILGAYDNATPTTSPLRIELTTAPNFVVDSNVESPSSYGPAAAYLGATFHNDGTNALTNVWAYIGDSTNGTPGIVRPLDAEVGG